MSSTTLKKETTSSPRKLHSYQHKAIDYIIDKQSCALFLSMGLGKTISALTAVDILISNFDVKRVLVIAPLRVCKNTWKAEMRDWDHVDLSHTQLAGVTPRVRRQRMREKTDIHIINRELTAWLINEIGNKPFPYDMVVIDESSSFKNRASKRFKALKKALPSVKRLVLLTGTPSPNGLLDLWAQIFLLDRGDRLGKTYTGFRDRYFTPDYMRFNWTLREGAEKEIHDKISDICLSMSAEDYLELPGVVYNDIMVTLPPAAASHYHDMEKEAMIELESADITALSAAAVSNKLLQISNGSVLDADKNSHQLHDAKLEALEEIIEANPDEPVIVVYNYVADMKAIMSRLPGAVLLSRDDTVVDKWNKGEIPYLVMHPSSGGHGLNLQYGGNIIVWFGLNWSLELWLQMNARLDRQGKTKPTIVHRILAENTIDLSVRSILSDKNKTQKSLLSALKTDIAQRVKGTLS